MSQLSKRIIIFSLLKKTMISEQEEKLVYLREIVQSLQKATIDGSAISMCLLPGKNMHEYRSLLASEIAQASNIKDKGNRQSVIESLKSAKQAIKNINKVPKNGLIILSVTCMLQTNHVYEKILQVIEPHRPITKEVYSCGKLWNFTHIKEEILVNDSMIGFIIIDGNSTLLASLKGSHYNILKEVKSNIMRNHNKGGQSSVRFSRLRDQSRYNFVKVSCQEANKQFSQFNQSIQGFIVAGSAGLKNDLIQNIVLSPSIRQKIISVMDIAQGSEEGLKQAISQSKDVLINTNLLKQKQIFSQYFDLSNRNSDKTTNGWKSVVEMIEIGLAEKVIVCKNHFLKAKFEQLEKLCNNNGCQLKVVSDKSEEGTLFVNRYGGISTILRYEFDTSYMKNIEEGDTMAAEEKEEFFL